MNRIFLLIGNGERHKTYHFNGMPPMEGIDVDLHTISEICFYRITQVFRLTTCLGYEN